MKYFNLILPTLLLSILPAIADSKQNNTKKVYSKGILMGLIVDAYWGDYAHIVVKDNKTGKTREFFVLGHDKILGAVIDDPKAYKNKKIKLQWQDVEVFIPENKGMLRMDEAISAVFLK